MQPNKLVSAYYARIEKAKRILEDERRRADRGIDMLIRAIVHAASKELIKERKQQRIENRKLKERLKQEARDKRVAQRIAKRELKKRLKQEARNQRVAQRIAKRTHGCATCSKSFYDVSQSGSRKNCYICRPVNSKRRKKAA